MTQHLSDEAVAAFADGVLNGHARERAARHIHGCAECRQAVRVQREAAYALRSAGAPQLPTGLLDRLRTVPQTTPITTLPTVIAPDGTPMLSTLTAPMAALVPNQAERSHRARPYLTTAAIVALAGSLAAGSVAHQNAGSPPSNGHVIRHDSPTVRQRPAVVDPVNLLRVGQP